MGAPQPEPRRTDSKRSTHVFLGSDPTETSVDRLKFGCRDSRRRSTLLHPECQAPGTRRRSTRNGPHWMRIRVLRSFNEWKSTASMGQTSDCTAKTAKTADRVGRCLPKTQWWTGRRLAGALTGSAETPACSGESRIRSATRPTRRSGDAKTLDPGQPRFCVICVLLRHLRDALGRSKLDPLQVEEGAGTDASCPPLDVSCTNQRLLNSVIGGCGSGGGRHGSSVLVSPGTAKTARVHP